jgi:predicted enzyme related to lactoylglutathione lyase
MKFAKYLIIATVSLSLGFTLKDSIMKENQDLEMDKSPENPPKVTGIGGIFFKCDDPQAIKDWYKKNLGLDTDPYGTNFEWRQGQDSSKKGFTQWSPFNKNTKYFKPSSKEFMVNYRVQNMDALVAELKKNQVVFVDSVETYEYGKFVHILDNEGNKVELWEPNDIEYDKIVEGRTF